jgi:hypothetical protein
MMNQTGDALIESIPKSVTWLGYGGLLPFIALALGCFAGAEYGALSRLALITYGAVILSFVGALHWAFAMTVANINSAKRTECFVWSVVPALLAWPAALMMVVSARESAMSAYYGVNVAATLLIAGFVANYVQDIRLTRATTLPAWYLPLRLRLTLVACFCLAVAGFVTA